MHHLIKDGLTVELDEWQLYDAEDTQGIPGMALLPVSVWVASGDELKDSSLPFGVFLKEDEDISALLPFLEAIKVVDFHFGKFADGRAFSYARQLRQQHGFSGEIRASGDFMPDQVSYLERCGFNAFACRSAEEQQIALNIKGLVTEKYQSDTLEIKPLYRRR